MPMFMNSEVSYAKATLPFPIYSVDFDPYNRGYLVVGGGGGEGRSGVPNQIAVLDVSQRPVITPVLDIDLSRDEDSVSSLANLATKDGLITLAGINSSVADQNAGNNQHFRSFQVQYPPRKRQKTDTSTEKGSISLLNKQSLFAGSSAAKKETYQRLLRLSPPQQRKDASNKRIGAIASGLAQSSEIIVFNATVSTVEKADIITKIDLPEKAEAADLDIAVTDDGEFSLAYCDDHNIYEQTFRYDFEKKNTEKRPKGPRRVHQMPFPEAFDSVKTRSKYRCLRFLDAQNVIVLANKANKAGAELRIYHLYPTGPAIEILHKNLPSHIKQATSMDVCTLDADSNGNCQVVVAVAGQDISIEIFTTDFSSASDTYGKLKSYNTFRDVHPQQMTKLCFAPYHPPSRAPSQAVTSGPNGEIVPHQNPAVLHPTQQYIRLASTSFGNTLVIDTFPLTPMDQNKKDSRYVLVHPNDEALWRWLYIIVIAFVVLVTAFLMQSFVGFSEDRTDNAGLARFLPSNVREFLDQPARAAYNRGAVTRITTNDVPKASATPSTQSIDSILEDVSFEPAASTSSESITSPTLSVASSILREIIAEHLPTAVTERLDPKDDFDATTIKTEKAIVVHDGPHGSELSVNVHEDKAAYLASNGEAKHWDELEEHQRTSWKKKLVDAGHWAESEGEAVLKGVLWSTYAGVVGDVAGQVLREL